jgi:hypothetical protein
VRIATDRPQAPTPIRTNLGAIFLSMELSRTTWLLTSLSPGGGERMSKHAVRSGDVAGLLARFPRSGTKYGSGQGRSFRSSLCRRRVWTVFGSTACWRMKGSKATSSIPPRSRCPAGADERRLTRSTGNPWCARCWRISEASRECAPWSRRRPHKRRIAGESASRAGPTRQSDQGAALRSGYLRL